MTQSIKERLESMFFDLKLSTEEEAILETWKLGLVH